MARAYGVVMLTIPPDTSHCLQPWIDLYTVHSKGCTTLPWMHAWLWSNLGKTVTTYDIPELVKQAQHSAITFRNIVSGYESTGISLYHHDLFTDVDFAPAAVNRSHATRWFHTSASSWSIGVSAKLHVPQDMQRCLTIGHSCTSKSRWEKKTHTRRKGQNHES